MIGTYSPQWCQHVEGTARSREADDDPEDPIVVEMRCMVCQSTWKAYCYSGAWDLRVVRFAFAHFSCWYAPVPLP